MCARDYELFILVHTQQPFQRMREKLKSVYDNNGAIFSELYTTCYFDIITAVVYSAAKIIIRFSEAR